MLHSTFCSALFRFIIWRLSNDCKYHIWASEPTCRGANILSLDEETIFPSLTWATYYASYIELTCGFIIACLPAIRQLIDKKIFPTIRGYTTLTSTKRESTRGRNSTAASPRLVISRTQETRVTTSRLDPNAGNYDYWDPDGKDLRTSRQVIIE